VAQRKPVNPFYIVLVIVGVAFMLTVFSHTVLAFRDASPDRVADTSASGESLMAFLRDHGVTVITVELVVLAIATVAAITTDEFWMRRAGQVAENSAAGEPAGAAPPANDPEESES
jgi:hypothetical protein